MNILKLYDPQDVEKIKKVAADSAMSTFGVVALANKNAADGIIRMFTNDASRGVEVEADDKGSLTITLYVIMQYTVRVKAASENLIDLVKYYVEKQAGFKVKKVEVNVVALRA